MEKRLALVLLLVIFVPFQNCSKSFEGMSYLRLDESLNTNSSSPNESNSNENTEAPALPNNNSNPGSSKTKICENNTKQIAFPGAEGFGRCAQGGRGGKVIEVTNLNDAGTGSLRDCMQQSGPRTCVFRVSGIINLTTCTVSCSSVGNCPNAQSSCQWPTIQVNHPYLTVAGQTAPGDGIMIKGGLETGGSLNPVNDIILRHLRIRPGYDLPNMSSIFIRSNNSIADHLSVGWVTDEGIAVAGTSGKVTKDVTIQWSIFSEGSHGLAIGGGNANPASNITVHHNYFAMNWVRNPQALSEGGQDNVVDIVNNLSYFWNDSTTSAPCRGYFHHN